MAYMEKREVGLTKFWEIRLDANLVTTNYGNVGTAGQSRIKEFDDQEKALEGLVNAVLAKYDRGYRLQADKRKREDLQSDDDKISKKPKQSGAESPQPSETSDRSSTRSCVTENRTKKRGLSGAVAPNVSKPLGFVDPESCIYGDLYKDTQKDIYDVMLVKENSKNDNYYIIQLIHNDLLNEYKVYFRWGRVGTAGQCQVLHPDDKEEALEIFEDKFWEKTGTEWDFRFEQLPQFDMYKWIKPPMQIKKKQQSLHHPIEKNQKTNNSKKPNLSTHHGNDNNVIQKVHSKKNVSSNTQNDGVAHNKQQMFQNVNVSVTGGGEKTCNNLGLNQNENVTVAGDVENMQDDQPTNQNENLNFSGHVEDTQHDQTTNQSENVNVTGDVEKMCNNQQPNQNENVNVTSDVEDKCNNQQTNQNENVNVTGDVGETCKHQQINQNENLNFASDAEDVQNDQPTNQNGYLNFTSDAEDVQNGQPTNQNENLNFTQNDQPTNQMENPGQIIDGQINPIQNLQQEQNQNVQRGQDVGERDNAGLVHIFSGVLNSVEF
eukprot:TRINITY_DN3376_c0_g1_i7.p1 TRINITY_DN3376_c0_g1~~TRINITY_DN3376_c0_g1_i7.p1  ORF type:complete len:546 (+),score=93.01 TRINITY_DN3376_c0_g1_i7:120-1757(+)